jgi:LPXTG-motif cell wall-anchored protein
MCRGTLTRIATLPSPGVPASRRIAAVAVSLAVALAPAAARAQNGAGDEQYSDPFANGSSQPAKPKPKPQQTQTQTQTQTQPTPVPPVPHQQVQSSAQRSTERGSQLPRTGFDVLPLALAGVALVAAGLLLRRRAAHGRD